jgi:hypothetical protein
MASKAPPIPKEQRSGAAGANLKDAKAPHGSATERSGRDPDHRGQSANTRINTQPQRQVQDR